MVKYTYDAWGNHGIEVLDSTCETLANLNPFRYRGYYYDTETDLYFLKSRYYDPEIGRFMTIDGIEYLAPDTINGLNLYAYCLNNPNTYTDHFGCIPFASAFTRIYYKELIAGFNHKWWGRMDYSITTLSEQTDKTGIFYAFSSLNLNDGKKSSGVGVNLFNWVGLELGVSDRVDIFLSGNITPWLNLEINIGASGISLSVGFNVGKTNHEFSIGIGFALATVVVGVASVVLTCGQSFPIVMDWFRDIFAF